VRRQRSKKDNHIYKEAEKANCVVKITNDVEQLTASIYVQPPTATLNTRARTHARTHARKYGRAWRMKM
jgi:hypothetical protein